MKDLRVDPRRAATLVDAARELRSRQTRSEKKLWDALRNRRLDGLKFRRQQPIGPFVVDFFCASLRLAVEIDGPVHDERSGPDEARQHALEADGIHVLRFSNTEVDEKMESVLGAIRAAAKALTGTSPPGCVTSPPAPLRLRGEG